jgi:hypothetical protein
MALEGISHDITPDRHIVTLYPNPSRIYTYFIVGGYTTTTTRTNLLPNPNFETNTTNWSAFAGASVVRSTAQSFNGTSSALITTNTTAFCGIFASRIYEATAGKTFTCSGYVRNMSGSTRNHRLNIDWYNGFTFISSSGPNLISLAVADGWVRFIVTGTAPAGTTNAIPVFRVSDGTTAGWTTAVDAVLFEEASSALPYFDGTYADTYTGYTLTSQGWSGTADASTSTATWGLTSSFVGSELNDDTKGLG